jgi:hypothetical protein
MPVGALDDVNPFLVGPDITPSAWRDGRLDYTDEAAKYNVVFTAYVKAPLGYNPQQVAIREIRSYKDLLAPIPFSLEASENADGVGDGPGLRWVRMRGPFELVVGHLPLDDARVAALPARGQTLGGDLAQQALDKKGRYSGRRTPRWKRGMARRSTRSVPVKLSRSGSSWAAVAASYMVRRIAR